MGSPSWSCKLPYLFNKNDTRSRLPIALTSWPIDKTVKTADLALVFYKVFATMTLLLLRSSQQIAKETLYLKRSLRAILWGLLWLRNGVGNWKHLSPTSP